MTFELYDLQNATLRNQNNIDFHRRSIKLFDEDPQWDVRIQAGVCKVCWYLHRSSLYGQAFTEWTCRACDGKAMHANTGVPRLCLTCCAKYHACVRCNGDLDCRMRVTLESK